MTEQLWLFELDALGKPSQFWNGVEWIDDALSAIRFPSFEAARRYHDERFTGDRAVKIRGHTFGCETSPSTAKGSEGETPRTDNQYWIDRNDVEVCTAHFARKLERELAARQAKIDRLMLEHCPDEMTSEQTAEWAKHQKPVNDAPSSKEVESDLRKRSIDAIERGLAFLKYHENYRPGWNGNRFDDEQQMRSVLEELKRAPFYTRSNVEAVKLVAAFEKAVEEAMHALATPENHFHVEDLREKLLSAMRIPYATLKGRCQKCGIDYTAAGSEDQK